MTKPTGGRSASASSSRGGPSAGGAFADTNVLLYLLSADAAKADRAEEIIRGRPAISVQVLNEFASVARRKLAMPWDEVNEILRTIRAACPVHPLGEETHDAGLELARRYGLGVYDAMILAAAQLANCDTLFSEDMQHGMRVGAQLRIVNPFL